MRRIAKIGPRGTLAATVVATLGVMLGCVLLLGVLPEVGQVGSARAASAQPSAAEAVSYNDEEIKFVELINQYRVSNGVEPLLVSDLLSDASAKHSFDMGKYAFFNHYTTGGSDWFPIGASPSERMVICGYPQYVSWGENIAAGYETAEAAFKAWKYSEGHNRNMLNSSWKVIGVGMEEVPGSPYRTYWTTDFGSYPDGTAHEVGSQPPLDVTKPVVMITSPAPGANLTGVVSVKMTATDNLAVTRVELYVKDALVGSDTSNPYVIEWDTSALTSGAYTIRARAYDASGNVGSFDTTVYVSTTPGATTTTTTSSTTTTAPPPASTTTTVPSTTTTTSTTLPNPVFPDVKPGGLFYEAVTSLAAAGVVNGYEDGLFRPDSLVTRAQLAKIIVLALGKHTVQIDNLSHPTFVDVAYTGSAYPYDFVEEAAALGIIEGYGDGRFGPQTNVSRAQLALMLVRAGGDGLAVPPANYQSPFDDVPAYAREAVRIAKFNGLLSGKTDTAFDPYSPATRGQVAKMVWGLMGVLSPTG